MAELDLSQCNTGMMPLLPRLVLTISLIAALHFTEVESVSSLDDLNCEVEYIVVGGGCAGGIVASRLAQAGKCVVLFERGKDDDFVVGPGLNGTLSAPFWHFLANPFGNPDISTSIWLDTAWELDRDWEPKETFGDTPPPSDSSTSEWQYGFSIFGGGSTANAMVYNRGNENIFKSWGWRDAWEKYEDLEAIMGPFLNSESDAAPEAFRALQAFRDVLGWDAPEEGKLVANGDESLVGFFDKSINDDLRSSVPRNFFPPQVRELKNLAILLETRVEKVLFKDRRAKGVKYTDLTDGNVGIVKAEREIILSAGPYLSPHLLMKSGIGPKEQLWKHGIDVVLDNPAVGQNYQNHLFLPLVVFMTFSEKILFPSPTFNGGEFIGHWYSNICQAQNCDAPDMQTAFSYYSALGHYLGREDLLQEYDMNGIPRDGNNTSNLWTMLTQPKSRGYLELNPDGEYPIVHANFLSEQSDIDRMVDGVKKMRSVAQSMPDFFEETTLSSIYQTDDELELYVKRYAMGQYHPAGTCRMMTADYDSSPDSEWKKKKKDSVVDPNLKVHGVQGLRVVDSSIMPRIQNGNTAAPSMLIGYYAADLILKNK